MVANQGRHLNVPGVTSTDFLYPEEIKSKFSFMPPTSPVSKLLSLMSVFRLGQTVQLSAQIQKESNSSSLGLFLG